MNYLIRRILGAIPLLIALSLISFALIQLPPGDYADQLQSQAMSQGGLSREDAQAMADAYRERYGLDQPMIVQYLNWMKGMLFHGDFGYSFSQNQPIAELVKERLPITLFIAGLSHVLATLIGAGLGIYAATRQYKLGDTLSGLISFIGMTTPRFIMALVLLYWLVFGLGLTNVSSLFSPEFLLEPWSIAKFFDLMTHIWPVLLIAVFGGMAYNLRVMRSNMLDVLQSQYIETARAKGLSRRTVVMKHAVPNASHPLVMYQGVALPYMIAGELEVAIVFALPTVGPLIVSAMNAQDVFVVSTFMLLLAVTLVIGNIIADALLVLIDPRLRKQ
ncbi:ABC transporter permease [Halomonas sp. BM-2019]|uniref:ABC transporter permease n=1 Tax=Halomonas sp. BM-2019 TaxID=2811227 RepID=UPI001B3C2C01|nr:MAG: ABC transporter permease [Halomonas sp. BM-2019]